SFGPFAGHWVDQWSLTHLDPELVEAAQHGVAVPDGPGLIAVAGVLLAGDRVDPARCRGRLGARYPARLVDRLQPQHEVADLSGGHLVPADIDGQHESPPALQRVGVAADRARTVPPGDEVTQEPLDRLDRLPVRVHHLPRHRTAGWHDPTPLRRADRLNVTVKLITQAHAASFRWTACVLPAGTECRPGTRRVSVRSPVNKSVVGEQRGDGGGAVAAEGVPPHGGD